MEVSPAVTEFSDKEEEEDLCRICRSPEESGNPLKYPCVCRGSIKYVHEECLRLWLNRRRGNNKCEVCGRSYCIVPLYKENAPEKLPWHEFVVGVLLRVLRFLNLALPLVLGFLLNTVCVSMHPWGREFIDEQQRDTGRSRELAYLKAGMYCSVIVMSFTMLMTMIRVEIEESNMRRVPGGFRDRIFVGNGLGQRVVGGVVLFLWKYMKILCDWYFLKLISLSGQQPRRRIFVPLNAPLDGFGVIRKLFFFVDDNVFAVLAISVYVHFVFVLLPFSIGWIVLATVRDSFLPRNSPIFLGYTVLLAYFGTLFTLCQVSGPALVWWFSLGFRYISSLNLPCLWWNFSVKACKNLWWCAMNFPCLLWDLLVEACKNLFVIKDVLVFCLKMGFLPWMIGWWLQICVSPLFGTTISQRLENLSDLPALVFIRWLLGIICLVFAESHMCFLQKIIHRRAYWYLVDVTDPDYKITRLNLGYSLFAFASHGVLLVILIHLPIKAITLINPSFFPLELWGTNHNSYVDTFTKYQKFHLIMSSRKWLIELASPAIKLIVENWIINVSSRLQLSDFLLVVPQEEDWHRADQNARPLIQPRRQFNNDFPFFRFYSIAEGCMVIHHESQNVEDNIKDQSDNSLLPRIALMLVLAALSLFLLSTAFMALPLLVGRVFFGSISFLMLSLELKHDDFWAFWTGCFIMREIYTSTCFVSDHIQKGRINLLVKYIFIWMGNGLLFSIWIFIIPGLLGLLIDLMIIIPLQVPLNESPVYFFMQDWFIGVGVLHFWIILTMLTPVKSFATEAWRGKLERIESVGIDRLPFIWLLREVICSVMNTLGITLFVPYLVAKSLFPLLGFSQSVNSAVERLIWPALLGLIVVWFMVKVTRDFTRYLHQSVFNERYLVGERVDNLTEDREQGMIIHGR